MSDLWMSCTITANGDFANMRAAPNTTSAIVDKLTTPQDAELDLMNVLTEDRNNPAANRWFHFRQTVPARDFWIRSDVVKFVNPLEARVAALETEVATLNEKVNQITSQHPEGG